MVTISFYNSVKHLTVCTELVVTFRKNSIALPYIVLTCYAKSICILGKIIFTIYFYKSCHLRSTVLVIVVISISFYDSVKHLSICTELISSLRKNAVTLPYIILSCYTKSICILRKVIRSIYFYKSCHSRSTIFIIIVRTILLYYAIKHLSICTELISSLRKNTITLPYIILSCYAKSLAILSKIIRSINFYETCHLALTIFIIIIGAILFYKTGYSLIIFAK